MEFIISPAITYFVSLLGLLALIRGLFSYVEDRLRPDVRKSIADWLKDINPSKAVSGWPPTFVTVFDRVFGERHLSLRCFGWSCLASVIGLLILFVLWISLHPQEGSYFFREFKGTDMGTYLLLSLLVSWNFLPDYFSILETRLVIHWMGEKPSLRLVSFLLLVDLLATASIWIFGLCLSIFFVDHILSALTEYTYESLSYLKILKDVTSEFKSMISLSPSIEGFPSLGIWFYSTFFTSVWIWLYVLSALIVGVGRHLGKWFVRLRTIFKAEEEPLHFIGIIASVIVILIYLAILLVRLVS